VAGSSPRALNGPTNNVDQWPHFGVELTLREHADKVVREP